MEIGIENLELCVSHRSIPEVHLIAVRYHSPHPASGAAFRFGASTALREFAEDIVARRGPSFAAAVEGRFVEIVEPSLRIGSWF